MSDSLHHRRLQHARLLCASLSTGLYSDSSPLSQRCYLNISSSAAPFSSCPQSFPASGSFPMSRLFASGGQSIGASASASVLPMVIQDWFSLGRTILILQSKGLWRDKPHKTGDIICSDHCYMLTAYRSTWCTVRFQLLFECKYHQFLDFFFFTVNFIKEIKMFENFRVHALINVKCDIIEKRWLRLSVGSDIHSTFLLTEKSNQQTIGGDPQLMRF